MQRRGHGRDPPQPVRSVSDQFLHCPASPVFKALGVGLLFLPLPHPLQQSFWVDSITSWGDSFSGMLFRIKPASFTQTAAEGIYFLAEFIIPVF